MRIEIFRDFPWRWAVWWIIAPNLAFIAMWPVGGPSMAVSMTICGLAAVFFSHWTHKLARVLVSLTIFSFNLFNYLALSFNLGIFTMTRSVQFLPDLNPFESPEYFVAGVLLLVVLVTLVWRAPCAPTLRTRDHKLLALGLVALIVNADTMATAGTRGSYKAKAPSDAPIDSAMIRTELTPGSVSARNLIVIIVESWGMPTNREDKALFDQLWAPAHWNGRYEVTHGMSTYYGSTTHAELREWCGVWADFGSYEFDRSNCLPKQFRTRGFETVAIHSFEGAFFDRQTWYPKIGFSRMLFGPDLKRLGASSCGGVFPGACDRDVPKLIGKVLRERPQQRKLVYWLTVNGHLPLPSDPGLDTDKCTLGDMQWRKDFPMLCRTYEVQRQIADSITAEIMKPDFPDADILIVGDHMPPFFPRYLRTRFDSAHVPWILLRNRASLRKPAIVEKQNAKSRI